MNLKDYLKQFCIPQAKFAAKLGVTQPMIWQWSNGYRPIHVRHCLAIERATNGQVTRFDLRPTDAHLIWPEQAAAHAATNEQEVASHG